MTDEDKAQVTEQETTEQDAPQEQNQDVTLDSIFNDSDESDDSVTAEKATEEDSESEDEKGEQEPDDKSEESDESEEQEESPSPEEKSVPMEALIAERRKRQELEKQLKEGAKKEEIPDPVVDPEGYATYQENLMNRVNTQAKINWSRELMLEMKEDFADMEKVFVDLIGTQDEDGNFSITDDGLHRKFVSSPNPSKFAYEYAKDHVETQKLKDPKYKENLKKELEAELRAELEQEYANKGVSTSKVPDLTKTAGKSDSAIVENAEEELSDIFADSPL